jgi:hypothetical protein
MTDAELTRHAEKAIVLGLKDDMRGFDTLREYVAGIKDDEALTRLFKASEAVGDAILDIQARERS